MKQTNVYIYAASTGLWPANEAHPTDLKPLLQTTWGKRFRRINHFIELTLVGAKSCLDQSRTPVLSDCDVYLASEHGNVADVAKITEALFKQHEAPMPLEFLNVPNNMAGFYLAQELKLQSSNLTIAHRDFAFETALDLAMFNMATTSNKNSSALVGSVEECAYPLNQHRQRLGLAANQILVEKSHWLHLGNDQTHALARCEWVKFLPDVSALASFLDAQNMMATTCLATSDTVNKASMVQLLSLDTYETNSIKAWQTQDCAHTIASFLAHHTGQQLVYINQGKRGNYAAVCISTIDSEPA